jgi:hypothetical protein
MIVPDVLVPVGGQPHMLIPVAPGAHRLGQERRIPALLIAVEEESDVVEGVPTKRPRRVAGDRFGWRGLVGTGVVKPVWRMSPSRKFSRNASRSASARARFEAHVALVSTGRASWRSVGR